jgi:hypothetical protein
MVPVLDCSAIKLARRVYPLESVDSRDAVTKPPRMGLRRLSRGYAWWVSVDGTEKKSLESYKSLSLLRISATKVVN